LKKAGVLGGTFSISDDCGTRNVVLPSTVLTKSATPELHGGDIYSRNTYPFFTNASDNKYPANQLSE
jgi:hypothetical protein